MSAEGRLKLVLCWHMHQPQYREPAHCSYVLPWTYLHLIKDYVDMAAILEMIPDVRAVVNFSPVTLDQIDDYATQIRAYLRSGDALRDPLLAALAATPQTLDAEQYLTLVRACLRVNRERLINRFPPYQRLADLAATLLEHSDYMPYLSGQFLADLLVWYHLAWMGETVRLRDARVKRLIEKGYGFTAQDRRTLLEVIGELAGGVIERYRALCAAGKIELSMTPYAHPIIPLMLNFNTAREAMPDVQLPHSTHYPGGEERARWHIQEGKAVFYRHFGIEPRGCWPAEGGVSPATLRLLNESGFTWAASGEKVLRNSLTRDDALNGIAHTDWLYQPYQIDNLDIACFFRDDGLSDLIGFTYSKWHSDDAVNNLIWHLENIAAACPDKSKTIVSIIMDGENAWEYYPDNAYHFLTALYKRLTDHARIELTTFSSYLNGLRSGPTARVENMVSGSWVYGTFSTWIGDPAKNRGWDMLCDAKHAFDAAVRTGLQGEALAAAQRQLAICEGSDWFWWFGDYNPAETVSDFEKLFRLHLSNLYRLIGAQPPDYLSQVISRGTGAPPSGGVMRASN
ncbi:MAG: glycoside hydrolase family 57 protein [Pseudomonadota bacterium]